MIVRVASKNSIYCREFGKKQREYYGRPGDLCSSRIYFPITCCQISNDAPNSVIPVYSSSPFDPTRGSTESFYCTRFLLKWVFILMNNRYEFIFHFIFKRDFTKLRRGDDFLQLLLINVRSTAQQIIHIVFKYLRSAENFKEIAQLLF